ncbi:MAG: hypothetical protein MZV65_31885 [Chromatiales bacterium]|nr:hypothetical protein [Chromatiales bacterium]
MAGRFSLERLDEVRALRAEGAGERALPQMAEGVAPDLDERADREVEFVLGRGAAHAIEIALHIWMDGRTTGRCAAISVDETEAGSRHQSASFSAGGGIGIQARHCAVDVVRRLDSIARLRAVDEHPGVVSFDLTVTNGDPG